MKIADIKLKNSWCSIFYTNDGHGEERIRVEKKLQTSKSILWEREGEWGGNESLWKTFYHDPKTLLSSNEMNEEKKKSL